MRSNANQLVAAGRLITALVNQKYDCEVKWYQFGNELRLTAANKTEYNRMKRELSEQPNFRANEELMQINCKNFVKI